MKKITVLLMVGLTSQSLYAGYLVNFPLEQQGGGSLPTGSINIKNPVVDGGTGGGEPEVPVIPEEWLAIAPSFTSWVDVNAIYGCTNWTPDPSTIPSGQSFTQNATDCSQDQTRERQEQEQEKTTLVIRNKGSAVTENQTIIASSSRSSTGTKSLEVCKYVESNTRIAYITQYEAERTEVMWDGVKITEVAGRQSSLNYNGYSYKVKGNYIDVWYGVIFDDYDSGSGEAYEVCRTAL